MPEEEREEETLPFLVLGLDNEIRIIMKNSNSAIPFPSSD